MHDCATKCYDTPSMNLDTHFQDCVGKRVLDIGCGTGNLGAALEGRGNTCYGVTIAPQEAELARQRMTQVIVSDIEQTTVLPFPKRFFDVVIFADILEHLRNPHHALKLVAPHLARNAQILVSIPNVANIAVRLNLLRGKFDYEPQGILDDTHVRFYTLGSAVELLTSAGYEVRSVKFTNWNWQLPRIIKWLTLGYEWELRDRMTRWWPGLFATQFVMSAELLSPDSPVTP